MGADRTMHDGHKTHRNSHLLPAGLRERGTISRFVDAHTWQWEGAMAVLTLVYVALAFADDELLAQVPDAVMLGLAAVFIAEFSLRFWDAEDRLRFARRHWVDAITAIPLLGPLRGLRLLRLLRLGSVLRTLSLVDSKVDGSRRVSLWFLGPLLIVLWMCATYAFWQLERAPINPEIRNYTDAMYLAFVSLCTLGFGDAHAVSPGGRLLGGGLIFFGLGFVSLLSTQITLQLLRQKDPTQIVLEEIAGLREELRDLRLLLQGNDPADGRAVVEAPEEVP